MKQVTFLLLLLTLLLVTSNAGATAPPGYQVDWLAPGTIGGFGHAQSAQYAVDVSLGQTAVGLSAGTHYSLCLGFWCAGSAVGQVTYGIYLPLQLRRR